MVEPNTFCMQIPLASSQRDRNQGTYIHKQYLPIDATADDGASRQCCLHSWFSSPLPRDPSGLVVIKTVWLLLRWS